MKIPQQPPASRRRASLSALALGAVLVGMPGPASAAGPASTPDRGQMLYENHCTLCHSSVVHIREDRRAKSRGEVADWVRRWSTQQKLGWSSDDVSDVADFLDARYYRFPLPPEAGR